MSVTINKVKDPSGERPWDVLVIDDEETFGEGCRQTLETGGYHTVVAHDGKKGLQLVKEARPAVVLIDLKMPGIGGMEVLSQIAEIAPSVVSIVVTGHGTVDSAVESMKIGAFDFLTKPFDPDKLLEAVRRGMHLSTLRNEANEASLAQRTEDPLLDKQDVLLRGLGVLGEFYSLGLEKRELLSELAYLESEAKYHAQSLGQVKKRERAILDVRDDLATTDKILQKHGMKRNALIQVLLDVQGHFRWLPRHVLRWISGRLNVGMPEIMSVATFYEAFSLEPRGRHTVHVCTGTACHVRGAPEILAKVSSVLGIAPGQTDSKQQFSLKTVNCLGCCALAPVMEVDGKYHQNPSLKMMENLVAATVKKES